jgi:hypothetical protein
LAALQDARSRNQRVRAELVSLASILADVGMLNDKLLETFARDTGRVVKILMARGEFTGQIVGVRDRMVVCKSTDVSAHVNIRPEDLSMEERMARLLPLGLPELFLVRGVTAVSEKRYEDALMELRKTGPVLSPLLTRAVQDMMEKQQEEPLAADPACLAFSAILPKIGIQPEPFDLARWSREIAGCRITPETAGEVERGLEEFLGTHGQSGFAANNAEMILALQKVCGQAVKPEPNP